MVSVIDDTHITSVQLPFRFVKIDSQTMVAHMKEYLYESEILCKHLASWGIRNILLDSDRNNYTNNIVLM